MILWGGLFVRLNYCLYCDVVFFVLLFCLCFFVFLSQDVFVHVRSCDSVFLCCLGLCVFVALCS